MSNTDKSSLATGWQYLRDFWTFVKPYEAPLRIVYVLFFVNSFLNLIPALVIRFYIDCILTGKSATMFGITIEPPENLTVATQVKWTVYYIVGVVALILVANTVGVIMHRQTTRNVEKVLLDIRLAVLAHVNKLSLGYFHGERTGTVMTKAVGDVSNLSNLLKHSFYLTYHLVQFLIAPLIMLTQSPLLFAVTLIPVPLIMYATWAIKVKLKPLYREQRENVSEINAQVQETVTGIREIKAFNMEDITSDNYMNVNRALYKIENDIMKVWSVSHQILHGVGDLSRLLITAVGGFCILYGYGDITIGSLTSFLVLAGFMYSPMQQFVGFYNVIQQGMVSLERIMGFLNEEPDLEDRDHALRLKHEQARGEVVFDHVSFRYKEDAPVLNDISLTVSPGEKVALVGPTGCGKSTLVSLLLRFYDPDEGSVRIGDKDVREFSQASLRQNVGIVFQDTFLFYGTIKQNLLFANPGRSMEEVITACKAANIHDDIMDMPMQYETPVGERGVTLSGGQRQRLSIARVFLKDPAIVILDEATSAVDTVTEKLIQQSIDRMLEGRTAFIIAHRLSTIRNCDNIIVLSKGQIMESGPHEELLKLDNGIYREMHEEDLA